MNWKRVASCNPCAAIASSTMARSAVPCSSTSSGMAASALSEMVLRSPSSSARGTSATSSSVSRGSKRNSGEPVITLMPKSTSRCLTLSNSAAAVISRTKTWMPGYRPWKAASTSPR